MELSVSKGGELLLQTAVRRDKKGVTITVRASASIEDMMATMALDQAPRPVAEYHRYWTSDKNLVVYGLAADLGGIKAVSSRLAYRLDRPGNPLDLRDDARGAGIEIINLSFLRLVGVSDGVSFTVNQVYSRDGIADLCKKVEEATRHFYVQYLKPIDMRIMVITQELS
jgi:hypothetical protein